MMSFLGNFARTGNPNDATGSASATAGDLELPEWSQHIPRSLDLMALGEADAGPRMAGKLTRNLLVLVINRPFP